MKTTLIKLSAVALCVGLMSGCATVTKEDLARVEATANSAQQTANEADRKASAAMSAATAAQDAANECAERCKRGGRNYNK